MIAGNEPNRFLGLPRSVHRSQVAGRPAALLGLISLMLLAGHAALVASETERLVLEHWYELQSSKGKFGYEHNEKAEIERDGQQLIRTRTTSQELLIDHNEPYRERFYSWELSGRDGKLREYGYRVFTSKQRYYDIRGQIQGETLRLQVLDQTGNPSRFSKSLAWDREILGEHGISLALARIRNVGQTIQLKEFDFKLQRMIKATYVGKGMEEVVVRGTPRTLQRIQQRYRHSDYCDPQTLWVDEHGNVLKCVTDSSVIGQITKVPTTKKSALARFPAKVSVLATPFHLDKPIIFNKRRPRELVLRFAIDGEDDHQSLFPQSPRQTIVSADAKSVTLRLSADRRPQKAGKPGHEFLQDNFFLRPSDPNVQALTAKAIAGVSGQRQKVQAISRWVDKHVAPNYEVNMIPADAIARDLRGDCTICSILAASMFRTIGIPSRLAIGIVIDESGFTGHQWIEVYLDGSWETCDPTGSIEAANAAWIKILDSSMKDVIEMQANVELERLWFHSVKVNVLKDD